MNDSDLLALLASSPVGPAYLLVPPSLPHLSCGQRVRRGIGGEGEREEGRERGREGGGEGEGERKEEERTEEGREGENINQGKILYQCHGCHTLPTDYFHHRLATGDGHSLYYTLHTLVVPHSSIPTILYNTYPSGPLK